MKVGGNVHISRDRNVMQEAEQFSEFPAKIRKKKKLWVSIYNCEQKETSSKQNPGGDRDQCHTIGANISRIF